MKYIADLHIHSPFSRATSKASNLTGLSAWARIKGIQVLGTGDFTHPGWLRQLKDHLVPAEPGFYKLKDDKTRAINEVLASVNLPSDILAAEAAQCRFVLSAEISSIYKRHGKVRKIHNVLFVPDFQAAERINGRLAAIGNIESDGRPILGLDSRNLLEILLEQAPDGFLVPAHIWTPWFSLFGSKSGFDSIEECFDDLTDHIFALETGLSSDPDMNRLVSALDRYTLISNSDCHSPSKLGREANLFDTDFHFHAMREALKRPDDGGFLGTIEFYPEEGKYHFDGHRKCKVCLSPEETIKRKGICPVCGRSLTVGVTHRVMELADRKVPDYGKSKTAFYSLIPLPEVLGEIIGLGPGTKGVMNQYSRLISLFGSEFDLLFHTPVEEINRQYSSLLGEAVQRIRSGQVIRNPGYDGEFGVIKVFAKGELASLAGQKSLFGNDKSSAERSKPTDKSGNLPKRQGVKVEVAKLEKWDLNAEQAAAVADRSRHLVITAGPGTGKTHTLIGRLVRLLHEDQADPRGVVAITFTNRAADEVRARLLNEAGPLSAEVFVGTFHGFCLYWLRRDSPGLMVAGNEARGIILKSLFPDLTATEFKTIQKEAADFFQARAMGTEKNFEQALSKRTISAYLEELKRHDSIDIDDIIPTFVNRLIVDPKFCRAVTNEIEYLFVDEFQDLNFSQYELVKILAAKAAVFAIGDPDQAIYGFRGSRPDFFYQFIEEFNAKTEPLVKNYRSAPAIIEAAGAVICHNTSGMRKELVPQLSRLAAIESYRAVTPREEAEFIVSRIEQIMGGISHFSIHSGRGGDLESGGHQSFNDIAVFYRLTQQALVLSEALERRGIPFQLVDVPPFYMRTSLRAAYYWVRVASGSGDTSEHLALFRYTEGIGASTLRKLEQGLMFSKEDFFKGIKKMEFPPPTKAALEKIFASLAFFEQDASQNGLAAALKETFDFFKIDLEQPETRRFLDLAGTFGKDLVGFSDYLKKNSQATVYDKQAETVSLMTLHAAKGLEFPVVFIAGVEEGLLPCDILGEKRSGARSKEVDIDEERRLFYVGITRARENLILTSSATRTIFGENRHQQPSRFLTEIPSHLLSKTEGLGKKRKKQTAVQMKLF